LNAKLIAIVCAALIGALAALQWEIKRLEDRQEKIRLGDAALLAAIEKFESDFLAKERAEEKARAGALAEQDAARRKQIDEALKALPMGSFRQPVYWNQNQTQQKGKN
jgi:hypothetical protein